MIYNNFKDIKLSALGMGCMRFPTLENDRSKVDKKATQDLIDYAIQKGVNYFDTAWVYHGGNSEILLGEILGRYPRDSFCLADKFPGFDLSNMDKVEEIFEAQLKKCGVEYFDFYLLHNVCEMNINAYLDPKFGIVDYLVKQKNKGRIRHLGFSTHGSLDTVKTFLDIYGADMEFCQIQLNWMDWDFQNAKAKVDMLNKYSIPIWVMEPVRGGALASLAPEYESRLKALRPEATAPEWCFRFLQSVANVTVTLSGMSNMDQLKENIATYESAKPLNDTEINTLMEIAREMTSKNKLPCTSCRYCIDHCPKELDIPRLIEVYNEQNCFGNGAISPWKVRGFDRDKRPPACIGCRACEAVCPQNIKISEMMTDFAARLQK